MGAAPGESPPQPDTQPNQQAQDPAPCQPPILLPVSRQFCSSCSSAHHHHAVGWLVYSFPPKPQTLAPGVGIELNPISGWLWQRIWGFCLVEVLRRHPDFAAMRPAVRGLAKINVWKVGFSFGECVGASPVTYPAWRALSDQGRGASGSPSLLCVCQSQRSRLGVGAPGQC